MPHPSGVWFIVKTDFLVKAWNFHKDLKEENLPTTRPPTPPLQVLNFSTTHPPTPPLQVLTFSTTRPPTPPLQVLTFSTTHPPMPPLQVLTFFTDVLVERELGAGGQLKLLPLMPPQGLGELSIRALAGRGSGAQGCSVCVKGPRQGLGRT